MTGSITDALVEAFASGDPAVLSARMAPGAVLWHNTDKVEGDAAEGFGGIVGLYQLVDGLHVEVVQHEALPAGELARFVVRGTVRATGAPLAAHNCVVLTIEDGRVTRLDEYVDPTFGAQLGVTFG